MAVGLATTNASAHRLVLFATESPTAITGKAYFADGKGRAGWTLQLADRFGNPLSQTVTESGGRFAFPVDTYKTAERPLQITLDLGDGHGQSIIIGKAPTPAEKPVAKAPVAVPASNGISPSEIDALLAARLAPLEERISDLAEERRFQDIVGAAGYIIGLFGLAFFVLGRKRR